MKIAHNNTKIKLIILFTIGFILLIINFLTVCGNKKVDKMNLKTIVQSAPPTIYDNSNTDKEAEFKNWLKDTLFALNKWAVIKMPNIYDKEIAIGDDSLSLKVSIFYNYNSNLSNNSLNDNILNILELLKEYKESPKEDFVLCFVLETFYYPSTIRYLKYDFVYEIKDIKVSMVNSEINYNYIRGRLSSKEEIIKDSTNKRKTIKTNFTWDGDNLIKKTDTIHSEIKHNK